MEFRQFHEIMKFRWFSGKTLEQYFRRIFMLLTVQLKSLEKPQNPILGKVQFALSVKSLEKP